MIELQEKINKPSNLKTLNNNNTTTYANLKSQINTRSLKRCLQRTSMVRERSRKILWEKSCHNMEIEELLVKNRNQQRKIVSLTRCSISRIWKHSIRRRLSIRLQVSKWREAQRDGRPCIVISIVSSLALLSEEKLPWTAILKKEVNNLMLNKSWMINRLGLIQPRKVLELD